MRGLLKFGVRKIVEIHRRGLKEWSSSPEILAEDRTYSGSLECRHNSQMLIILSFGLASQRLMTTNSRLHMKDTCQSEVSCNLAVI